MEHNVKPFLFKQIPYRPDKYTKVYIRRRRHYLNNLMPTIREVDEDSETAETDNPSEEPEAIPTTESDHDTRVYLLRRPYRANLMPTIPDEESETAETDIPSEEPEATPTDASSQPTQEARASTSAESYEETDEDEVAYPETHRPNQMSNFMNVRKTARREFNKSWKK